MTPQQIELCARLRTYLGGDLGEQAAREIERLVLVVNTTANPAPILCFTIESVARWLEPQGLTIVSAADAEKVRGCGGCGDDKRDAERYRFIRAEDSDFGIEKMSEAGMRYFYDEKLDAAIDLAMKEQGK